MSLHNAIRKQRTSVFSLLVFIFICFILFSKGYSATLPILPQTYIDTSYSLPTGNTITVNSGGNFQAALNNAALGDVIVLQAGATFQGPFILPNKTSGSGWIYIVSSAYNILPPPGTRVSPVDAPNMPTITVTVTGGSAIRTANYAHHYRFVGIEVKPVASNFIYNLIQIGNADTSESTLPSHITFDRCYIHGDPNVGGRRGIAMDGKYVAVIDSYISDFKEAGADTQALWAYNTPGPIKIYNNYLEAAGENVMFGGADPKITNLVPADIEVKRNYMFKPLSWVGSSWVVKNIFELKNAKRVLIEGNIFQNIWVPSGQNGFAIVFTPRNQENTAPWTAVQDITFRHNKLIGIHRGFNILGRDYPNTSEVTARIRIHNNLLTYNSGTAYINGAGGRMHLISGGLNHLIVDHNTAINADAQDLSFTSAGYNNDNVDWKNNIGFHGRYGWAGDSTAGNTNLTLSTYYTNTTMTNNAFIGGNSNYPSNNYLPANVGIVKFVNYSGGNYRLASDSPYKNAGTDGKDLGADIDAIEAAIEGGAGGGVPQPPSNLRIQ